MSSARVVIDTDVLISHLLIGNSTTSRAVSRAIKEARLLVSEATLDEFAEVLGRKKLDTYVSREDRQDFFRLIARIAEWIPITATVRLCRDPRDDKFLELAVSGSAAFIITGDRDLLALPRFDAAAIITPAQFLALPALAEPG